MRTFVTINTWYCLLLVCIYVLLSIPVYADWESLYYRDHPLVGKIYSTREKDWVSAQGLQSKIRDQQYILLGETHSNPDHHARQAKIIEEWLQPEQMTALLFEMLAFNDWPRPLHPELSLDELLGMLKQVAERWDWNLYEPILQVQMTHQLPMWGANLTRQQLDEYAKTQKCHVGLQDNSLNFCESLSQIQQSTIRQLILDAHCGYLPESKAEPLLRVQMAKDASFALAMMQRGKTHKIALIAGANHVRKDIGVPVHLQRLGKPSISIGFMNVAPNKLTAEDYGGQVELGKQFDYVLFTPSERNQDPCVEFARQLKKMKNVN